MIFVLIQILNILCLLALLNSKIISGIAKLCHIVGRKTKPKSPENERKSPIS